LIEQAERAGLASVLPIGAITKDSQGTELAEMGEMKDAGIIAVSDDGRPVPTAGMMRRDGIRSRLRFAGHRSLRRQIAGAWRRDA
jgi:dihydroorotase-like cyclic amidohydrolase